LNIAAYNNGVILWLIQELNSTDSNANSILTEFSMRHNSIKKVLFETPGVYVIDTAELTNQIEELFDKSKINGQNDCKLIVVICLILVSLKYTLATEKKISEFKGSSRKIPVQKKLFEVLAKYKREGRKTPLLKKNEKLSQLLLRLDFTILKKVNSSLGKSMSKTDFNLSFLARLLFELVKVKISNYVSDNALSLILYPLFREIYPELVLIESEENWLNSDKESATSDNFRTYQIKKIKSIIYYDKKDFFEYSGDQVDLERVLAILFERNNL